MFNLFKKKAPTSGVIECRDMYSDAFHLITRKDKDARGEAFCGQTRWTEAASGIHDIIPADIIASYEQGRRKAWYYCPGCILMLSRLTGIELVDPQRIIDARKDKAEEDATRLSALTHQLPTFAAE